MSQDLLETYREMRDFGVTPEPAGEVKYSPGDPIFVIQKHDASTLHYDFRLEVEGVLKSWSVPKGPSLNPSDKRLAIPTEDHPMDYAKFEGNIPVGEYGAGSVIIWDRGTYRNLKEDDMTMQDAVRKGRVEIRLEGEKLRGAYALVRASWGKGDNWLLIKKSDEGANRERDITAEEPQSVVSGRTVEEIAGGQPFQAVERTAGQTRRTRAPKQRTAPPKHSKRVFTDWQDPMLATLTERRDFPDGEWLFEPKLDGVRCLAYRNGDEVNLYSRNQKLLNNTYPELVEALRAQPTRQFVVDGEIVALENGVSSFTRLQNRLGKKKREEALASSVEVFYFLFDLLSLDRRDVTEMDLVKRKELLRNAFSYTGPLRYSEHRTSGGEAYFAEACRQGWEGLIAKRANSCYVNDRSDAWLKLKCIQRQEFVIGGYTDPQRSRVGLGALLIGYYKGGDLVYAGKVGVGFDAKLLRRLSKRLQGMETEESPFAEQPRLKGAHWVKPQLVAEIGYSEWTEDGKLRHPRFEGLRDDKPPREVIRERPQVADDETRQVGLYTVEITSRNKLYFPESGLTKDDLVDYYQRVAGRMLPYLENRAVMLHRFPNGIEQGGFFQKQVSGYFPDYIERVTLEKEGGSVTHPVIENAAALVYLANQGAITFHTWLSRLDKPDHPDRLIFDLDPSVRGFELVRFAARAFRDIVKEIGLVPFLMTTGSRGLHVTMPLDRSADFDTVRDFAQDLALLMAQRHPDQLTVEHQKRKRGRRLYLDTARNSYAQTAVAPYSVRARPGAPVAAPLEWKELDDPDLRSDKYNIENLYERLEKRGDPWRDMGQHARSLEEPRRQLDKLLKRSKKPAR